jgi:molybdopterin converting factor subunit 1
MRMRVLLFASYADALGGPTVDVDLAGGATVRDLVDAVRRLPNAATLPPAPLVAVNHAYAGPDHPVTERDEIALIPPVAGG